MRKTTRLYPAALLSLSLLAGFRSMTSFNESAMALASTG